MFFEPNNLQGFFFGNNSMISDLENVCWKLIFPYLTKTWPASEVTDSVLIAAKACSWKIHNVAHTNPYDSPRNSSEKLSTALLDGIW